MFGTSIDLFGVLGWFFYLQLLVFIFNGIISTAIAHFIFTLELFYNMIDLEELTALLSESMHFRILVEKEVRNCVGGSKVDNEGEEIKLEGLVKEI